MSKFESLDQHEPQKERMVSILSDRNTSVKEMETYQNTKFLKLKLGKCGTLTHDHTGASGFINKDRLIRTEWQLNARKHQD